MEISGFNRTVITSATTRSLREVRVRSDGEMLGVMPPKKPSAKSEGWIWLKLRHLHDHPFAEYGIGKGSDSKNKEIK